MSIWGSWFIINQLLTFACIFESLQRIDSRLVLFTQKRTENSRLFTAGVGQTV